ncbi:dynamin family protein [Coleofasciculus sp. FACHB-712]|uniref:dynamin family protein n=1 Tax=Coleofasciculus sp. FACHB-712 TaxID=2692789 RepID=UPI0016867F5E|nr:dynamin family protein [Coleofasciculus sp. FACHB-712]MBD1944370.1 dynamin family protein [Coleofasciculus sp. FACHB-712]
MSQSKLQAKVDQIFNEVFKQVTDQPDLENFHHLLQQCHQQLHQPMRVAIVGLIKAGKSTLMNALLEEAIVSMGAVEATFNVNWLKYGNRPSLMVYFKDTSAPEKKSFEELAELTLRADKYHDYLLSIKYIEVSYPNDILKMFSLIDTPGLQSFYEDDSQNTRNFLQLHGRELTEITQVEAANADAVLYLFSRSLGTEDKSIIEEFQGQRMGQTNPINAIGVLTKVDFYASDPKVTDPLATGNQIAQRLANHPQVRRLLYTVKPVCGLLALGAKTLKPEEFVTLTALAQLPEDRFKRLIRNVTRFCEKEYDDIPISPSKRKQVLERLGQYGIDLSYSLLRSGITEPEELATRLVEYSGLDALCNLILSHFGRRAFLIKLGTSLRQISAAYFQERRRLQGTAQEILKEVVGKFEALQAEEHAFQELNILRSFYEGKLDFDEDESRQLLEVTGEYGISCGERLGLGERATVAEMLLEAEKRIHYWQQRAYDPMLSDRQTMAAAGVLVRSYERILSRVQKAKENLYIT